MNIREWTLPIYTILTQLSVGALCVTWVIRALSKAKLGAGRVDQSIKIPLFILFTTIVFAIIFAHFHLSRPFLSFLALRNIGSSWLSRELSANLIYILLVGILLYTIWSDRGSYTLKTVLGWAAIIFGLVTEYCMSRIYLLPSQPAWNSLLTPISFLATTFLLGVLTVPMLMVMDFCYHHPDHSFPAFLAGCAPAKICRIARWSGNLRGYARLECSRETTLRSILGVNRQTGLSGQKGSPNHSSRSQVFSDQRFPLRFAHLSIGSLLLPGRTRNQDPPKIWDFTLPQPYLPHRLHSRVGGCPVGIDRRNPLKVLLSTR